MARSKQQKSESNRKWYQKYRTRILARVKAYSLRDRTTFLARKNRNYFLNQLKNYGLTFEDFSAILIQQSGRCATCNRPLIQIHLDHDHNTGRFRGLLCIRCNTFLGAVEKWSDLFPAFVEYLQEHG